MLRAGARTIAFDISFKEAMREEDEQFARAFSSARMRKTAIVVEVFDAFEDGAPVAPELLNEVLGKRVVFRGGGRTGQPLSPSPLMAGTVAALGGESGVLSGS